MMKKLKLSGTRCRENAHGKADETLGLSNIMP